MEKAVILMLLCPFFVKAQNIYLIGDAGDTPGSNRTLELLNEKVQQANEEDVLIFLGNNLYPKGLPNKEHTDRKKLEQKLLPQLEVMKSFKGSSYMIPGNHDWASGKNKGWQQVVNMENFVNEFLNREDAFVPQGGCPGPIEVQINPSTVLIVLNTQYYLHPWDKPDEDGVCENKSTAESLNALTSTIQRHSGKHILIAAHHPIFTYGEHNGNFSFKSQMTPLPLIGSMKPFFRKTGGSIQDNTHPNYKSIMNAIRAAMDESDHVIFVSGHEHALQLINREDHHFIVSGSGSEASYLKPDQSEFGRSEQGFAQLQLEESGKALVKFWGIDNDLLYTNELYTKDLAIADQQEEPISFQDSTVTVFASEKYIAGKGKRKWFGANYRDVWATPIKVEVFDLGSEKGGLKVLKKGGGMQTKSLRMEASDGRQYVLRSIEKYPENAMPAALRKTFAQSIVQDQISSSHPYGAFIIPKLAEAAQVYHTNPVPVYIPDDPRLGAFRSTFAGTLAVYEERPNKKAAGDPTFGGGNNVKSTFDVIERLKKDNDNSVDQNFVVRNRLFDMWLGDWDRHDDQWRWVIFDKEGKGDLYRPIPRDRDQVFFLNEGIIPWISSRKWALPKIEGFDEEVRWAPGLGLNARYFDRTFTTEADWNDWEEQVTFLQKNLTDEVIEEAVSGWPEQIQELTADRVIAGLKARRADMNRYAREHYLFLSKEVEIVGSDKHEYFLVDRLDETQTKVTVYKRKKDGEPEKVIYERTFKNEETKEIRLFGLDGEDIFEIKGKAKSKIKVRIIGGTDKDVILNNTGSKMKNVLVYDRKKSTQFEGDSKGVSRLSENPEVNSYDRKAFKYDILMPIANLQFTPDDGLFFGGGFVYTKHAWRKNPYASKHLFLANFSASTNSFNFKYSGSFTDLIGKWSFNPEIVWQEPFFVNNFFGIGNETEFLQDQFVRPQDDDPIDYYRVKMKRLEADLDFSRNIDDKGKFYIGTGYRSIEVERTANRFISDIALPEGDFQRNNYFKIRSGVSFNSRDSEVIPTRGMVAKLDVERFIAVECFSESLTRISGEWKFYFTAKLPSALTIGNRIGAAHNFGDFEFFNANTLGGLSNLRGFRRTRFYGETSFYHNLDLRLKLLSFRSYIFPGQFGIQAFHDTGRVWIDGENSETWHTGKGVGIWVSPLDTAVIGLNYAFGEDENLLTVNLGFFF